MGIIKKEDVIGWRVDDEILCDVCADDVDTHRRPITKDELDKEFILVCDGCDFMHPDSYRPTD